MSASYVQQEILFIDSFQHDKSDNLNLDHVKFTYPVYIDEIRLLPKGCELNLNNTSLVGETYPNTFKIEIFGNNLNRKFNEKATFDKMASFNYKRDDESVIRPKSLPIDWLIIKGPYTSLTVVVIGVKAKPSEKDQQMRQLASIHDANSQPQSTATTPIQQQQQPPWLQQSPNDLMSYQTQQSPLTHLTPPNAISRAPGLVSTPYNQQQSKQNELQDQYQHDHLQTTNAENNQQNSSTGDSANAIDSNDEADVDNNETAANIDDTNEDDEYDDLQLFYDEQQFGELNEAGLSSFINTFSICTFNPYQMKFPEKLSNIDNPGLNYFENKVRASSYKRELKEKYEKIQKIIIKDCKYNDLKWLESFENQYSIVIDTLLYLKLRKSDQYTTVIDKLIELTDDFLNYEPKPSTSKKQRHSGSLKRDEQMFKIRKLKFGLKLVDLLTSKLDENVCKQTIEKLNVQAKLIDLFEYEHMYTQFKLRIVKSIDRTLYWNYGYKTFITSKLYQRLLSLFLNKKLNTRVYNLLSKLMSKINFYDCLIKFCANVQKLVEIGEGEEEQQSVINEINELFLCIYYYFKNALTLISQPNYKQNLTINTYFTNMLISKNELALIGGDEEKYRSENENDNEFIYKTIYKMFNETHLVKYLLILWSHSLVNTPTNADIQRLIELFLRDMITNTPFGVEYFLTNNKLTTILLNQMLQTQCQPQLLSNDDIIQQFTTSHVAFHIVYSLQTYLYVNQINDLINKQRSEQSLVINLNTYQHLIQITQSLCVFLTNQYSKQALIETISTNKTLLSCLVSYLTCVQQQKSTLYEANDHYKKLLLTSIVELFYEIYKNTDSGLLVYKHEYTQKLNEQITSLIQYLKEDSTTAATTAQQSQQTIAINKQTTKILNEKLKNLQEFIEPCMKLKTYTHECIPTLVNYMKSYIDRIQNLPKSLITCLRILKHMCIVEEDSCHNDVCHKLVIGELISIDCLHQLFQPLIKKLSDYYIHLYERSIQLSVNDRYLFVNLLKLLTKLTKLLINNLIELRSDKYNDITVLTPLYSLNNVCTLWYYNTFNEDIYQIKIDIIDILMLFTNLTNLKKFDIDTLRSSVFTSLYKCLIEYTMDRPSNFVSGLQLFSELLPIPLPILTKYELESEFIEKVQNERKLLHDHLFTITYCTVRPLISSLVLSTNQMIQQLLKRICIQLADLSSHMCLFVMQTLLDLAVELFESSENDTVDTSIQMAEQQNDVELKSKPISNSQQVPIDVSRLYTFISTLLNSNQYFKLALIHVLNSSNENDDKYRLLIINSINYCFSKTFNLSIPTTLIIQESIFYLLQLIIDCELELEPKTQLPNAVILRHLVSLLIDNLIPQQGKSSQYPTNTIYIVNLLILLCRHDYGFELVYEGLVQSTNQHLLYDFMKEFDLFADKNVTFYTNLLSSFYEFINLLVPSNQSEISEPQTSACRSSYMSINKFKELIQWNGGAEEHPLTSLQLLIESNGKCEDQTSQSSNNSPTQLTNPILPFTNDTLTIANNLTKFLKDTDNQSFDESQLTNEKFYYFDKDESIFRMDVDQAVNDEQNQLDSYFKKRSVYIIDEMSTIEDIERIEHEWISNNITMLSYDVDNVDGLTAAAAAANQELNKSIQQQQSQSSDYNADISIQYDKVEANLEDLIQKCLSENFDLNAELTKGFGGTIVEKVPKKVKKVKTEVINTRTGLKYKAPMRGGYNGGLRSNNVGSFLANRNDSFRSRQPNTSRPPSVHVDDFYRLQTENMNKMSVLLQNGLAGQQPPHLAASGIPPDMDMQDPRWRVSQDNWNRNGMYMQPMSGGMGPQRSQITNINPVHNSQMNQPMNSRSRFVMPPGTYSLNKVQPRERPSQLNEFLTPMPPPLQPTNQVTTQPRFMRFNPMGMPIDRRTVPYSDQMVDDMMRNRQPQSQQQQQQPQMNAPGPIRYPLQNAYGIRPHGLRPNSYGSQNRRGIPISMQQQSHMQRFPR